MKITEKGKPINAIPKGVWEASNPSKDKKNKTNDAFTESTDLQGNGYPMKKQSK